MFRVTKNKVLLFIEPYLSSQPYVRQAQIKGYKTFIISANDTYLNLPNNDFMNSSAFFQVDTHNEEAVLNLVTQLAQRFNIEGVISGYDYYGPLTAKIASYLKKPGLRIEIAFNIRIKNTSHNTHFLQEEKKSKEYSLEGMIKNQIVYIFIFTKNLFLTESNPIDLGYIVQSKINQSCYKIIKSYLQDVISTSKLDYGFFQATVRMSDMGPSLSNFTMRLAKDFMPKLINYATGIDYYDKVFELFSNQPVFFHRTKTLNAGIIFFYKKSMKKKMLTQYMRELSQNPVVLEVKEYSMTEEETQQLSDETKKMGHAILIHQDYKILEQHMQEITKKVGFLL